MTEVYTELLQENSELEAKIFRLEQENNTICYNLHLAEKERDDLKKQNKILEIQIDQCNEYIDELKQENKELKEAYNEISNNSEILHENHCLRIANAKLHEDLSQTEISMQEWKSQSDEARMAYNNLLLDIVSDVPFTGEIGGKRDINIKDHLHQMQKALASLEEIQKIITQDCKRCTAECDCDDDCTRYKIKDIINEVLNDSEC